MRLTPVEWTLDGFIEHFDFVHHQMPDHKFVWILGAGTSLPSGIPLGSELVDKWLQEIRRKEDKSTTPIETWATAANLQIADFKYEEAHSSIPESISVALRTIPMKGLHTWKT